MAAMISSRSAQVARVARTPVRRSIAVRAAPVSRRGAVQVCAAAPLVGSTAPDFKATAVVDQVRQAW